MCVCVCVCVCVCECECAGFEFQWIISKKSPLTVFIVGNVGMLIFVFVSLKYFVVSYELNVGNANYLFLHSYIQYRHLQCKLSFEWKSEFLRNQRYQNFIFPIGTLNKQNGCHLILFITKLFSIAPLLPYQG